MEELMLKIDNVSKMYKLGQIGGTTLRDELQRLSAKIHRREDPTKRIGAKDSNKGETFMALNGVSFEVRKGERVGIIGHNGAGKSTLLKLISRVTAPTEGTIGLNGRVASMLEVGTGFHGELTGRENIYMNGAILGMTKKEIDAKIEDIIDFSEVRQFIDTPVKRYSSGMYVKLAFSVAAHLDSEIMIMDEVLAVGDMAFQKKCLDKMADVSRQDGRTILYVSHNMNTIRQLCDRVIVLDHGTVVFDGDVEEGIGVYLGIKFNRDVAVNLDRITRDPEFRIHPVTMQSLEILNQKSAAIKVGSELQLRLKFRSDKKLDNVFLRMIVKTMEGVPVTMMTTDNGISVENSDNNSIRFTMNLSGIVPGRYSLSPVIYQVNEFGNNLSLDGLKEILDFEIASTPGFNHNMGWRPRYWGYFHTDYMRVSKDVE